MMLIVNITNWPYARDQCGRDICHMAGTRSRHMRHRPGLLRDAAFIRMGSTE